MRWSLLWLALCGAPAHADRVDRIVAVVEDQLVLESEVRLERELSRLDDQGLLWAIPDPQERLIDAAVLRLAAADVALYQPDDEDIRQRREAIRAHFTDRASWRDFLYRHGLTEDRLAVVLRRRMVAERYLRRNLQADPADQTAWSRATAALVEDLRARFRIRVVPEVP